MVHFGINLPSNSEKKNSERSASLRSAMWFILASISRQIYTKNSDVGLASLGHLVYFFFNPLKCLINDRFGFAMCEKYYSASAAGFFYCGGRDLNMKYIAV